MSTKTNPTNDERIAGNLSIRMRGQTTVISPSRIDPATRVTESVIGLNAARAWLDAHGGYATLGACQVSGYIAHWSVMRKGRSGLYEAGVIIPLSTDGESVCP